ncbi:MAG: hypothetical protein US30_C0016G0024 [Candidatus Moranbacteria bacterium GW2011_GWF2_36_839]|nr:MAG: hypothetical protein US27_C0017G0024 [Candidatus Moranbacteria bacterium GW2011_GWF1_36_78]KKQ16500.1 MAG: hypothetical protein US30_C0016G0024 [Candidatus Moranbacteria bacterium GW2011_GWF2_36_839]
MRLSHRNFHSDSASSQVQSVIILFIFDFATAQKKSLRLSKTLFMLWQNRFYYIFKEQLS